MEKEKLTRREKLMYGIGDIGFSLTTSILGAYFAIFMTDVIGIRPGIAAIAIFIGRSWDYINDPIFGHISDRTRTRWGRRRPFLLFGFVPYALFFAMLWWKPPITNQIGLAAYYSIAYILYEAAATFVYMPYFALTPELTSDYDERTSLTTYRMFFSILGSLIAFTIPLMIVGSFSSANTSRVFLMGSIFGLAAALPLLAVFFGTREREEFSEQKVPTIKESINAIKQNKPFLYSLGIFLSTWIAVEILQASLLFYIKYVLEREAQSDLFMATIFITAIFALPLWGFVSRKWSKRLAYIYGISFWAIVQIILITVSPLTTLPFILILCMLAGTGIAAAHVLPWAILPDAIEWGELHTNERHEGMYYSLTTLMKKIAASLALPLMLLLLEFTGYAPNASTQVPSAVNGIKIVFGPIPALLLLMGITFAWHYPLERKVYLELIAELEAKRSHLKDTIA